MINRMGRAKQLIVDVDAKIKQWDEISSFKLKGARNLSMSDMDTLKLYAEQFINTGGTGFSGLMEPRGEIAKVLTGYELIANEDH